jgi:endonuclease-3 related protein
MDRNNQRVEKINQVYHKLHSVYGPQGWWPIDGIYEKERKRQLSDAEKFEIMVGAILTQNTTWKNVELALEKMIAKKAIDPEKILKTPKSDLAMTIRSAGYYNQKAERLKILSDFVIKNPMRGLSSIQTQKLRETLLGIKGIGPETADSMILYAFGKPIFVIDAYTKRIMSRMGVCGEQEKYEELQKIMQEAIASDVTKYQEYHALLVQLAKEHCKTRPECKRCPLSRMCRTVKPTHNQNNRQTESRKHKKEANKLQNIKTGSK